jgi:HTH-type transcriptional regulator, sugar sensing transcriptional regulator
MNESEKSLNIINSNSDSKLYQYKLGIEKITEDLTTFGLTKTQAKVFIYLGKYGSKTSPEVCKDLKLPRTETYHILNILTNRGIVVTEFSHPTKFSALPIDKAMTIMLKSEQTKVNMLEEKEQEIAKLWKQIPSFFTKSNESESEKFQMLQGSPRIHSKMKNMILAAKTGCKIFCGAKDLSRFYYSNLIDMFESLSVEKRLIISSETIVPQIMQQMSTSNIRNLPKNTGQNQCFLIKDEDELLIFLRNANYPTSNIFAFWTDSKSLIASMNLLFYFSWKNSKQIKHEKLIIT